MSAREYEAEGRLSRFSLDRRITVLVLFLSVLVVGTVATLRIPVELIPRGYDDPWLTVRVPWQDAPPREVLDKVTLPLEEELSTVRGIKNMWSLARTGNGIVWLAFKYGTDMDVAFREVRDRVERAKVRFPDDIDRTYVMKDDASGIPVFVLGVAIDGELSDSYNLIQNEIVLPISRTDGVASVEIEGLLEKEVLIELDREKTAAAGVNIWELAQTLGTDNFTMASGHVRDGPRKLLLRSMARYGSLEELEDRLVAPAVRLGDVATITYDEPDRTFRVRAMSKPAYAAIVFKEGEANIRDVSRRIAAVVEGFKSNPRLGAIGTVTIFSQGEVIDEALATLLGSGAIGGVIAAMVLLFFLRRFRLTAILALGIPLSMLLALTVMYFTGETLNLLTLLGLMICVGLLVDNSVVVAENIHRLHREGMERRQACIHGAGEVGLAITMSTLTTIVVFLPVALADGPAQFFLLRLAIPVCVSVGASLLVALVFIPLCVFLTLPANGRAAPTSPAAGLQVRLTSALRVAYEATFGRLGRGYGRLLGFFLRRRLDLVLGVLAVFALTAAVPMQQVKMVEAQEEERAGFEFDVEMPPTSTLEETEQWFLAAEKVIESKKEELDLEGWLHWHNKRHGEVQGWFKRPRTNGLSPTEAAKLVKEALPQTPGVEITLAGQAEMEEESKGPPAFTVMLHGEDPDQLEQVKEDLEDLLSRVDGVLGARTRTDPPPSELGLVIDRERTQRYGVNPQAVAGVVGLALRGTPLPKFYRDGKEIPVRIRFEERDRESLTELADFMVPTASGEFLPVSALTDTKVLTSQGAIFRKNKRITRAVTVELEEGKEEQTRENLALIVSALDLPEGISFRSDGQQENLDEDLAGLFFALALSVVFIYLLMGFLFESFVLPLSIILTIPLSVIGVYWTHLIVGMDIDFLGVVAIVLLVGVVVNNGIVLIDYVNRLRARGHGRQEALLAATSRRFRPIMMTAITTIGGLVPLYFAGASKIGLSYSSFSMTLIGGMTTATLLTLLVVPVFYTFFDDLRETLGGAVRVMTTRGAKARRAEAAS